MLLNETIMEEIFKNTVRFDSPTGMSQNEFVSALHGYFRTTPELRYILTKNGIDITDRTGIDLQIDTINFFISDSLFCLSQIFDLVTPMSNSTLFPYSFMGEISEQLLRWNFAFEILHLVYMAVDHHEEMSEEYAGRNLLSRYINRDTDDLYRNFDSLKSVIANKTDRRKAWHKTCYSR